MRDRDSGDRRAVLIRVLPDRDGEVRELYADVNSRLDQICAADDDTQLGPIIGFVRKAQDAGGVAAASFTHR